MLGRSFLPSLWKDGTGPEKHEAAHPFYSVQKEMNRLFDDFFRGLDAVPFGEKAMGKFSPAIDVREGDKELNICVELPGMDEKDVEVLVTDDILTIKGEKKEEKEDEGKDYYHIERTFGSFQRGIPLPPGIDGQKATAKFRKGVLSITLPKTERAKKTGKRVAITSE